MWALIGVCLIVSIPGRIVLGCFSAAQTASQTAFAAAVSDRREPASAVVLKTRQMQRLSRSGRAKARQSKVSGGEVGRAIGCALSEQNQRLCPC